MTPDELLAASDPGPTTTSTPVQDLANLAPIPSLAPADLGVQTPPPGPAPAPFNPAMLLPSPQQERQRKIENLIQLAALIGGGTRALGFGQGMQQAQAQENAQIQQRGLQQLKINEYQQQEHDRQQRLYDQETNARNQVYQNSMQALRKALPTITTQDEYDRTIQAFASGMQAQGIRISVPQLIQAARWAPPSAQMKASTLLDKILKHPANAEALKTDPGKVLAGSVDFDANGDGIPEHYTLAQLSTLAGRPVVQDAQGQPVVPTAKEGKIGSTFQETLQSKLDVFQATNQRPPTPQEKAKLVNDAVIASKEHPPSININASAPGDIESNAQQLVDGDLAPSMLSKRAASYNATLARANKLSMQQTGKPLNFVQLQAQQAAAQKFAQTMNGQQMIRFRGLAGSVINTIDEVSRLGDELKQGNVQLFNRASRGTVQQVYGNTPQSGLAAQYLAAVNTLKEEFANLINGGYAPTEAAFNLANSQVNADFGVKDLQASLAEVQRLIRYRVNAMEGLGPLVPGQRDPGLAEPPSATPTTPGQSIGRFKILGSQ